MPLRKVQSNVYIGQVSCSPINHPGPQPFLLKKKASSGRHLQSKTETQFGSLTKSNQVSSDKCFIVCSNWNDIYKNSGQFYTEIDRKKRSQAGQRRIVHYLQPLSAPSQGPIHKRYCTNDITAQTCP